jgi:signal peptidase I
MKIKRSWGREWARPLEKMALIIAGVIVVGLLVEFRRIEGDGLEPDYKDGDLVLVLRYEDTPFLQLRVRGFGE